MSHLELLELFLDTFYLELWWLLSFLPWVLGHHLFTIHVLNLAHSTSSWCIWNIAVCIANSVYPDQMPHSAVSDLVYTVNAYLSQYLGLLWKYEMFAVQCVFSTADYNIGKKILAGSQHIWQDSFCTQQRLEIGLHSLHQAFSGSQGCKTDQSARNCRFIYVVTGCIVCILVGSTVPLLIYHIEKNNNKKQLVWPWGEDAMM